jgi:hypothetical protein
VRAGKVVFALHGQIQEGPYSVVCFASGWVRYITPVGTFWRRIAAPAAGEGDATEGSQ